MSRVIRGLLTQSNEKLGGSVFHFDLPAGDRGACPGRTPTCNAQCYAQSRRFLFPQVQARLSYCFAASKRNDFAPRLASELYRKGVLAMRWMVSGDVYSPGFAKKIKTVVEATPFCRHWLYSRSWRIPAIEAVLRDVALLDNASVWYSADRDAFPVEVPPRVRVAYMMSEADDLPPESVDLVFLVHKLRRINLPMLSVCQQETPEGREAGVTCSTCQLCLPD